MGVHHLGGVARFGAGEEDHRRGGVLLSDHGDEGGPIDDRHLEVADDAGERTLLEELKRRFATECEVRAPASFTSQESFETAQKIGLVIDKEYGREAWE